MAENDRSFPKIAESNWWKLRNLFKQKVPSTVTTTYLASALSMAERSARGNVITPFKKLGILDDDSKPTDLAYDWRDDSKYSEVCQKLLKKIYPQEVLDLYPSLESDRKSLDLWFMNYCRCGKPAATMFSTFYRLLLKADPSLPEEKALPKQKGSGLAKPPRARTSKADLAVATPKDAEHIDKKVTSPCEIPQGRHGSLPQLHINIQLHISAEATAEQIDKIFESMARHLKDFRI